MSIAVSLRDTLLYIWTGFKYGYVIEVLLDFTGFVVSFFRVLGSEL